MAHERCVVHRVSGVSFLSPTHVRLGSRMISTPAMSRQAPAILAVAQKSSQPNFPVLILMHSLVRVMKMAIVNPLIVISGTCYCLFFLHLDSGKEDIPCTSLASIVTAMTETGSFEGRWRKMGAQQGSEFQVRENGYFVDVYSDTEGIKYLTRRAARCTDLFTIDF